MKKNTTYVIYIILIKFKRFFFRISNQMAIMSLIINYCTFILVLECSKQNSSNENNGRRCTRK